VNEVVEDPITGSDVTIERLELEKGSARDLVVGDIPLLMESIEVAGDTPSDTSERRVLGT